MKLRILSTAMFMVALVCQTYAQCTTGCSNTITLSTSSSTQSFTFTSSNQTLCIVKSGVLAGNATISSGTIDFGNQSGAVICIGPGVVVSSGVSFNNLNSQSTINNYGTLQNNLTINQSQQTVNNFGTFSSANFNFSTGTFVNNTGASFNLPTGFSPQSGTTFSGAGSFAITGTFNPKNGASVNIGGPATITGSVSTEGPVTFGSTLNVTGDLNPKSGGPITVAGAAVIGGTLTTEGSALFSSTLNVTGAVNSKSGGPLTVLGAATFGSSLTTEGTTNISGALSVAGALNVKSGGPLTVGGNTSVGGVLTTEGTTNLSGSLSVTGAVNVKSGGPLNVSGNTTIGGALTTEGNTNLSGTLIVTGSVTVKSGGPLAVSGNTTIGGSLQTEGNTTISGSVNVTGSVTVKSGGPLTISGNLTTGGSMAVETTTTIGGFTTITNSGNTNPALNVPSGGNLTMTGGGSVTGNYNGGGTTAFNGSLNFTGSINNPSGGTITSSSSACKTLCAMSITNSGTISSTSGPNMNVCTTPSGGTQTNVSVSINPTANVSGLSASSTGSVVNGVFTAASPIPGGYIVLRKGSAFAPADLPVNNTTYTVGNTIGGATVVALLSNSATTFSYSSGCGSFYFAVISSSNNSGSCGTYRTSSYTTTGPVAVSCSGNRYWVSNTASNWNSTANWSTSSGGVSGASVPSTANLAIFDNARNGNCTIDATVDVLGIQVSGYTGTITQNANPMTLAANGYSQTSGTFTGGSSSITVNTTGVFSLSGGTFTSTSAAFTITGGRGSNQTLFNHSAGTFNHNNGQVVINPNLTGCANPSLTVDIIPATTFYDFEFNGVAGCGINATLSTGTGDVVACNNNFSHTDGILAGSFSFRNNLIIGTGADGGTGTITANGTGAQTYSASVSPRTCQLIVNKSSGALAPVGGTTDLSTQGFSLVAGSFTAPSGTLNVGGPWGTNVTIFNHSAGTFTHNNGTVEFNPTLINCANPTLTVDIIPATAFYNFTVNGIAGCGINATLTTGTGDVVACANNFTHTDGIISGAFSFQNNLSIGAGADGGTGTITANGTGAQTYTAASATPRTCQFIVNKSSGALTPTGGTNDLSTQGFSLVAGSFTAPSGTLNVGGPWGTNVTIFNHSAGTFTHNNGTIEFNPTLINCANPTFTVDVIPATSFYNFNINGIAGCGINATISTATGDVVACTNNFTHTDGIIAGNFSFQNNLILNAGADGGTGTITANGSAAQTYSNSTVNLRTCQLIVNKPSGALTPAGGTTDLITQGFSLVAGSFTAPSGTLNVGGPWGTNVTIFNHSAGTFTHNNGTVEFNPTLINCANPTFTVDVIPATLLYNFVVNGIAGCGINATISTATGDVVQGAGDFNHADGIIAGNFAFRGNLWIYAGADGGTGTITANSSGAQTYYQAAGSPRTCQLIVNKSSGALTPDIGVNDLRTQGFSLVAGSFTAPSGTLNVGGPWGTNVTIFNHSAGTYTHNNGTVEFNPTLINCANPTFTVDVIPATLLYNFVVNGIAGCGINATISTATGDVVQAANNFTHTDGIIAGNFAFQNNLMINIGADGGTGTITANGTSAQTYYQAAGSPRTCQLIVNKTSGALTPAVGEVDLWTQGFSLVAGSFTAPTGTLNVGGQWGTNVTIFNHSAGTFTHNNGTVEFNPTLINCANPTFTVDVIPATLLYNFVVNGIAGCGINATISTAAGDVVQAANNFTHTDGIIAGNFAFQGNLSIGIGADGGTGTITANGTGAQTYYQAAGTPRTCQLIVTKTSGALTPAAGTTDLLVQGFSQTSGNFTAPTGTLNVGGNWGSSLTIFGHTGGTFSHNNGTVEFNPTLINCANPTFTFDVITATQLYNFKVNGLAGCGINATMKTAAGDTLDVTNNLTYTDGVCNGMIETGGNTVVASTFDGGTGRLIFKGGNSQTFDLTGATNLFDGPITLNKTANSVTLLSACTMDGGSQSMSFVAGKMVSTSINLLTYGSGVTVSGASNASFVNGIVRKVGNQAFTFPVGKGSSYAAIGISAPGIATDHFTAEYFAANPNPSYSVSSKENTLNSVSTCEYWNLERTNGTSNISVTLSWDTRSCAVSSLARQGVARWNGSSWVNQGTNGSPTGNTTAGTVTSCSGVSSFATPSPFTIAVTESATISYAGSPFCKTIATAQSVTFSGLSGGTYTSSPAGLSINASTGDITPSTSTAGTYTVTYTVTSSASCANVVGTASVTITTLPTASISYAGSPWCTSVAGAAAVTFSGTAGGTYSASPSGLSLNTSTGAVTPSTSTSGSYTVTYTIAASGGCAMVTATATTTINSTPVAPTGTNGARCGTGAVTISATPGTGETIDWYAAASGGPILAGGTGTTSFTTGSIAITTNYYAQARNTTSGCISTSRTTIIATVNTIPAAPTAVNGSRCGTGTVNISATPPAGSTTDWYAASSGGTALLSGNNSYTTTSISSTTPYYAESRNTTTGCISATRTTVTATINAYPVVAVTTGSQTTCVGSTTTFANATAGGTWSSANTVIATVNGSGVVTGVASGTININYTITNGAGCQTTVSRSVTVYPGAQGTPNSYGNGLWNAYVYNASDYTSNYSGYYTTASALSYNTTTDFTINQAPSLASTYQGCQVSQSGYSIRYQRTNFTSGIYRIEIPQNDDEMQIILNGTVIYTAVNANNTLRTNVWTGNLNASSLLEIRYANSGGGPGYLAFNLNAVTNSPVTNGGTIAGNQAVCSNATPTGLTSSVNGSIGTCTITATPYQWEISTDNISFTQISGGNSSIYTIPGPLSQTTYYRRAYRSYCDTVYSNTITKTVTTLPAATISYSGSPFCTSLTSGQPVSQTGTPGGSYSASPSGLSINTSTGDITPSTSTAGTYTVTYTIAAAGGCSVVITTTSVTITTMPSATITYSGSPWCTTAGLQSVTRTGTSGGTFTTTSGLIINSSTGQIIPSSSTAGTYIVTYTVPASGGCSVFTTTTSVTVTTLPTAAIFYPGTPWCLSSGGTKTVFLTGTSGGNYSSTSGLSINISSGTINVAGSATGSYTVTYDIVASGGCASVSTTTSVGINGDVTVPTTPLGALSVCQASTPVVFSTSVSNYTGISWAVSGTGNTISGSGTSVNVNWNPSFSGTAFVSVSATGCGSPTGPVSTSVFVNPTGTWLGASNNWNTSGNWCGGVPTSITDVIIPSGATNMPQINAASFSNHLTLQNGTTLTINGANSLTIYGIASNSGTILPGSSSTVTYASGLAQTVLPLNYANLATSGAGTKTLSGTIGITGSFTPGGSGPFVTIGSTIQFNGSAQNIPGFTFNNLETSGNNDKSLTGDVTVNGVLNITNGRLAISSSELTLNGTISGPGNLIGNCSSKIRIAGSGSTGTLRFDAGQNTLGHLSLSKSAAGYVSLGSDVNICSQLDLSNGKVDIGIYNLTLLSGASSVNQNANSYVQTLDQMSPTGAGFFIRELPVGGGEFTFPVGTASYTPAYIDNIGTTRSFKIRAFNGVFEHGISGGPVLNSDASVNRTWEIEPLAGAGTPNVSIRLEWNVADEGSDFESVRQNNRAYIGKNEGYSNSLWLPQTTSASNLTSPPYSITTSGITTFSKFAIGNTEEPLPLVMGDLRIKSNKKNNTLSWITYSEIDAKGFEMQRSYDGKDFESIGFVAAKGSGNTGYSYEFEDKASPIRAFYKVKFIGNQETDIAFSNTVIAAGSGSGNYIYYPNPTSGRISIESIELTASDNVSIHVLDMQGRLVDIYHPGVQGGKMEIDLQSVSQGVYVLENYVNEVLRDRKRVIKE